MSALLLTSGSTHLHVEVNDWFKTKSGFFQERVKCYEAPESENDAQTRAWRNGRSHMKLGVVTYEAPKLQKEYNCRVGYYCSKSIFRRLRKGTPYKEKLNTIPKGKAFFVTDSRRNYYETSYGNHSGKNCWVKQKYFSTRWMKRF